MKTYITEQGDTFDKIAYKQLGSCNYLDALMEANKDKLNTFIFSAGETVIIPDVENLSVVAVLPPWRQ